RGCDHDVGVAVAVDIAAVGHVAAEVAAGFTPDERRHADRIDSAGSTIEHVRSSYMAGPRARGHVRLARNEIGIAIAVDVTRGEMHTELRSVHRVGRIECPLGAAAA